MTINIKYAVFGAIVLALVLMFSVSFVAANPSFFLRQNDGISTTATTTRLGYLTAGTGTTTIYFDSMASGNPYGADSATLLWQFSASSTNSTQDLYVEYAQSGDCITTPSSCDWYSATRLATTSPNNLNQVLLVARWQFASTTQGVGAAVATNNRIMREIEIPTPTRYARAMFVIPSSLIATGVASSSAVWAEFVAKKENR